MSDTVYKPVPEPYPKGAFSISGCFLQICGVQFAESGIFIFYYVLTRSFLKWLSIFSYIADPDVGDLPASGGRLGDLSAS